MSYMLNQAPTICLNVAAVERRRQHLGMSKSQLARRVGITPGRYTQILKEAVAGQPIFAPTAKDIGIVLGLKVSELFVEKSV